MTSSSRENRYNPLPSQLGTAATIWDEYRDSPHPIDRSLGNYFHQNRKRLGAKDRRFLSEVIYALFRHKSYLEAWSDHLEAGRDSLLTVLMAAALEDLLLPHEFEGQLRERFSKKSLPSSLYDSIKNQSLPPDLHLDSREEELALRFSFPLWLVQRWHRAFGERECESLLASLQERPPLVVRANSLKIQRKDLMLHFKKKGWETELTERSQHGIRFRERAHLFDTDEFRRGFFEIQDEGSQIVCQAVDPKPGEMIWDVCAGGGGKSLFLAALMHNKGRIIATDIRKFKLDELKKRASRAGAYNIFPAALERISESREVRKGVDKILVDAPCSGTGTLRRNPDAKWKLSEEKLRAFHEEQTAIIEKCLPFLKKGGRLYYATCSLEPEENEEVIKEICARHPELVLKRTERLWPHHDGTDGFFLAVAEKY